MDKEWYTPRASNDGILKELSLIETLNIERIKTIEEITALLHQSMAEVDKQVNNVYDYIESVRRYYLDTPEDQIEDRVWQTVDDRFEGKVTPKINHIFLSDNGDIAYVDLEIKDTTTITPVHISWRMIQENAEWRVDNIIILKDGYFNLLEIMDDFVIANDGD